MKTLLMDNGYHFEIEGNRDSSKDQKIVLCFF